MPTTRSKPPVSAITGEFGRRVRLRREELELSQEKLAERVGLRPNQVYRAALSLRDRQD